MARKFHLILCITVAIISICVCDMKTLQSSQKRHSLNYIQDRSHKVIKVPHEKYDQHIAKPGNRRRINIYEATSKNVPKVSSNDPEKSPKCKNDAVYCEYANNYPQDSVNKLSQSLIGVSLQIDKIDLTEAEFGQRYGDVPGNMALCEAPSKLVFPKIGTDSNGKLHFVANGNTTETMLQGFNVQECEQAGCKCNARMVPVDGYRGQCRQYYTYRTATTLNYYDGKFVLNQTHIKLPAYCACILQECDNSKGSDGSVLLNCDG